MNYTGLVSIVPEPDDGTAAVPVPVPAPVQSPGRPEPVQGSRTMSRWVLTALIVAAVSLGLSLFVFVVQVAT